MGVIGGASAPPRRRSLPVVGAALVVGLWALVPPWVGPRLAVAPTVEIVDHALPAVAVLAAAVLVLGVRSASDRLLRVAGAVVWLAGFWMAGTHVPLVVQAVAGAAPWGATVHHTLPGVAVLAVGSAWVWRTR